MTPSRTVQILGRVTELDGAPRRTETESDSALVDGVLRDLEEAAQHWEAVLAQAREVSFAVDLGDVQAVANADGELIGLTLQPTVTTDYSHAELAARINRAFDALRDEVLADFRARYGATVR